MSDQYFHKFKPHRDGLVSASCAVDRGFEPWLGYTKDHHKNGTNCLPAWHTCVKVGFDRAVRLYKRPSSVWNCIWGHAL